jgi:hypothetical protein
MSKASFGLRVFQYLIPDRRLLCPIQITRQIEHPEIEEMCDYFGAYCRCSFIEVRLRELVKVLLRFLSMLSFQLPPGPPAQTPLTDHPAHLDPASSAY